MIVNNEGNCCSSDLVKVEVFSEYFSSIGTDDNSVLPDVCNDNYYTEIKRSVGSSVFDKVNFDPSSIFNAVVGLNEKSAPRPDENTSNSV